MSTHPLKFELLRSPDGGEERRVPASAEAEEQLLSACLVDTGATVEMALSRGVSAKAFYDPVNAALWEVLVRLYRSVPALGVAVFFEEVRQRQLLEAVGGMERLLRLTAAASTTLHASYFVETLLRLSALRMTLRVADEMVEKVQSYAGEALDEFFAGHLSNLSEAVRHARRGGKALPLAGEIAAVVAEARAAVEGTEDRSGWVLTGLPTFDARLLPLGCQREDKMVVIAAGSGNGKSAIMRQFAGAALKAGQRARVYSRETSTAGFVEQLAATWAELDLKHRAGWTKDMLTKFELQAAELAQLADRRLWCVQHTEATPLATIEHLEADARHFAATQGAPHLWVVDYLQLFGTTKRTQSREQEIAHVSHRLQALCRELDGVWLIGCQLNESGLREMRTLRRDADDRVIHRLPGPGDLRESQAIYHDADRVIAHYLPPVDSRDQDQTSLNVLNPEVWLCQIKRRRGATGVVKCTFEKRLTRFVELPAHGNAAGPAGAQAERTTSHDAPRSKSALKGREGEP